MWSPHAWIQCTVLLGVCGTIYSPYSLKPLKTIKMSESISGWLTTGYWGNGFYNSEWQARGFQGIRSNPPEYHWGLVTCAFRTGFCQVSGKPAYWRFIWSQWFLRKPQPMGHCSNAGFLAGLLPWFLKSRVSGNPSGHGDHAFWENLSNSEFLPEFLLVPVSLCVHALSVQRANNPQW